MAKTKRTGKTSKRKLAAEIGVGLAAAGAAAAASYYLYGSKNAKKHRKVAVKELRAGWELVQREAQKGNGVVKKTATRVVRKAVKRIKAKARKRR
ncbi:MAG: hypothetical protein G01um101491_66 [Parcubacteria group bacterium Gr01-1014_91]|nr:MAG: hypothetical protein G01um101491_66 [Parcubacteria group bacterium Gr01-1014_91]